MRYYGRSLAPAEEPKLSIAVQTAMCWAVLKSGPLGVESLQAGLERSWVWNVLHDSLPLKNAFSTRHVFSPLEKCINFHVYFYTKIQNFILFQSVICGKIEILFHLYLIFNFMLLALAYNMTSVVTAHDNMPNHAIISTTTPDSIQP